MKAKIRFWYIVGAVSILPFVMLIICMIYGAIDGAVGIPGATRSYGLEGAAITLAFLLLFFWWVLVIAAIGIAISIIRLQALYKNNKAEIEQDDISIETLGDVANSNYKDL